jgi:hypothetical protein
MHNAEKPIICSATRRHRTGWHSRKVTSLVSTQKLSFDRQWKLFSWLYPNAETPHHGKQSLMRLGTSSAIAVARFHRLNYPMGELRPLRSNATLALIHCISISLVFF